jgi:uncharacterized protein (TIGR04141 family)
MADEGKRLRITVFLIKEEARSVPDFLETTGLRELPVKHAGASGTLYYKTGFAKAPSWVGIFADVPGFDAKRMLNSSCRAAYVIKTGGRWFCFTFGYARHLIRDSAVERNFGLKVALNLGDPETIKAIDKVSISHVGMQSREQAGRDVGFEEFEFNTDIDLLKSMTAKGPQTDDEEQETYSGRDSVSVYTRVDLDELPDLARRLQKAYENTAYLKRYPWFDKITQERDAAVIDKLESALVSAINSNDTGKIWLAIPELLTWEEIKAFAYRPISDNPRRASPGLYPDLDLDTWLRETNLQGRLARSHLSSRKVYQLFQDDRPPATWTVLRCLNAEIDLEDRKYILNDGDWYNIEQNFVQAIDDYYKAIPSSTLVLPRYGTATEPVYLRSVARTRPEFALMDCKLIKTGTGRSTVEFCDLYSNNRDIIHVKQYGGSSLLSHLFAQAVVSGSCFLYLEPFRRQVNDRLPVPFRLADCQMNPRSSDYTVCLAVMSKVAGPLELPFFSKVNLRYTAGEIRNMGYNLTKLKIDR